MEETKYIWLNGEFVPWNEAKVHALTHTLHYGAGAFEGIRAYETKKGPAIFRLRDHLERLFYSVSHLKLEVPFSVDSLVERTTELVRINSLSSGYIRPLIYFGYGVMGLNPKNAPVEVLLACWPWGKYLPHDMIDVKISSFRRVHPDTTVADAKLIGHYVNSIHAVLELRGTHYHEALLLDCEGNIAEGPGENFFFAKGGKLFTPQLGRILNGLTRDTVFAIAGELGIEVVEGEFRPEELASAEEAFFTGTAAEIAPIRSVNDEPIGNGETGPLTRQIREEYRRIVCGEEPIFEHFLTYANPQ